MPIFLPTTSNVLSIFLFTPSPQHPAPSRTSAPLLSTTSKFGVYLYSLSERSHAKSFSTAGSECSSSFFAPRSRGCGSCLALRPAQPTDRSGPQLPITNAARTAIPNPFPAAVICAARSCTSGDMPITATHRSVVQVTTGTSKISPAYFTLILACLFRLIWVYVKLSFTVTSNG